MMKIFKRKKVNNQDFVNIKYSKLDHIGKVQRVPIIQKETIDNLQTQIEQLKTNNEQLQNSVNSLQNNLSSVNDKISKLGTPIRIRRAIKTSDSNLTYKFTQVDIGNNTVLMKLNSVNLTGAGFFYGLKPNTNYLMDIYLNKFQINRGDSYKNIQKFLRRIKYTTNSRGELASGEVADSELNYFISTEKYVNLPTTFAINEIHLDYLLYEEVVI